MYFVICHAADRAFSDFPQDEISKLFVSARDNKSMGEPELDEILEKISMQHLFELLKTADTMNDATIMAENVKEIWKAHLNSELRWRLDSAVSELLNGNTESAVSLFSGIIDEDPNYAEAWNKASTCEFMLGNMEASLTAARQTLKLNPNHFQALNGLGLIHYENNDIPAAVECFKKSLSLDPWSPVASRLSTCLGKLESKRDSPVAYTDGKPGGT